MANTANNPNALKKEYNRPELKNWGTVADLTQTGLTNPGDDLKNGSVLSPGQ